MKLEVSDLQFAMRSDKPTLFYKMYMFIRTHKRKDHETWTLKP